ncbi:hypothetical protein DVH02_21645, partial [Streptomyces corynorhini]
MGLLSWLRGDRATGGDTSGSGVAARSGEMSRSAAPADRAPADAGTAGASRNAWRELPPLQRTLGATDLITDPSGFEGSLSSRQDTALSTAPLGHLVSPEAPSGLVHGLDISDTGGADGRGGTDSTPPSPSPAPGDRTVATWPAPEGRTSPRVRPSAVPLQRSESAPAHAHASAPTFLSAASAPVELPVRQLMSERPIEPSLPPAASPKAGPVGPSSPARRPPSLPVRADPPPLQRSALAPGLGAPLAGLPPTAQRQVAARAPGPMTETASGPDQDLDLYLSGDADPHPHPASDSASDSDSDSDSGSGSGSDLAPPDASSNPLLGHTPPLVAPTDPVSRAPHVRQLPEYGPHPSPSADPVSVPVPVPIQRLDTAHPQAPLTASGPVTKRGTARWAMSGATGPDAVR